MTPVLGFLVFTNGTSSSTVDEMNKTCGFPGFNDILMLIQSQTQMMLSFMIIK